MGYLPGQPDPDSQQHPLEGAPAGTGAAREGCALLQGLVTCGVGGRKLAVDYAGPAKATPDCYCISSDTLVDGKGARHLRVGGVGSTPPSPEAFLAALHPTALQAYLAAAHQLESRHHAAQAQWRRRV